MAELLRRGKLVTISQSISTFGRTQPRAAVPQCSRGLRTSGAVHRFSTVMKNKSGKNGENGRIVHVGLTQMACTDDAGENLRRQVKLAEKAAAQGAQIICTQELFRSKYFCQSEDHRFFKLAETIPGPSTDALGKVAKKHGAVVIASLFEKRAD